MKPNIVNPQTQLRDFHRQFGAVTHDAPTVPDAATCQLRKNLHVEEMRELNAAIAGGAIAGVADAIADVLYVVYGTAVSFGIDIAPIFEAVHAANMTKVGGLARDDGKILKPPGWQHPDIAALVRDQERDAACD